MAVLSALVLATPVSWRRRFSSLAIGLAAVLVIMLARHVVMLLFVCMQPSVGLIAPIQPWDAILRSGMKVAAADIVTSTAVCFVVWLLVCFQPCDWASWIGTREDRGQRHAAGSKNAFGNAEPEPQPDRRRRRQRRLPRRGDSAESGQACCPHPKTRY